MSLTSKKSPAPKKAKTCKNGHTFYKSSDCPVCPICEQAVKPQGFLADLGAPARRALEREGITTLKKLATFSAKDLLKLHGFGPSSIPPLTAALKKAGLSLQPALSNK